MDVGSLQGEVAYAAWLAKPSTGTLINSYSGETTNLVKAAKILKEHQIPTVLITNIGENSLLPMADCVLHICTREKLYSKIASFSTDASIEYLLDVLYSCIFRLDYDESPQMKIRSAPEISGRERTRRQTSLSQAVFSSADTAFKRPRICFLRSAFCVSHISILLSKICDGPVLFLDGDII